MTQDDNSEEDDGGDSEDLAAVRTPSRSIRNGSAGRKSVVSLILKFPSRSLISFIQPATPMSSGKTKGAVSPRTPRQTPASKPSVCVLLFMLVPSCYILILNVFSLSSVPRLVSKFPPLGVSRPTSYVGLSPNCLLSGLFVRRSVPRRSARTRLPLSRSPPRLSWIRVNVKRICSCFVSPFPVRLV